MTKIELMDKKLNIVLTNSILSIDKIKKMIEECVIIDNETSIKNLEIKYLLSSETIKKFSLLGIEEYLFETLSKGEKTLVKILHYIENNDLIVINNLLLYIDSYRREMLLKYLKKANKTVVVITLNQEELMFADKAIIYANSHYIYKSISDLVNLEKTFKELDTELPFMVQLSLKLKYYNLVEKPILSMSRMVNKLWK